MPLITSPLIVLKCLPDATILQSSATANRHRVVNVYAGSEAEAAHDREPVAIFTGEVLPLYAADRGDDAVRILLNELASEIGRILEQEEIHIAYRDRT